MMLRPLEFASLLMVSTALVSPSLAFAQTVPAEPEAEAQTPTDPTDDEEQVDVSIPGMDDNVIVVQGRARPNIVESAPQVVSILSTADIARTGEGDIAGALGRVTGLSIVGNGFVYVRGLGDRYSLALLNGSPLPSPEPLKRVVPLDLFPTSVIASSLVQKTYSANFPGEFGGGVINLTTKSSPTESFLTVATSIGYDSETTGQLGYTYYGSATDWTGFDNGNRDIPPALKAYFNSGQRISTGTVDTLAISRQLVTGRQVVVQRNTDIPANFTGSITGGTSFDIGSDATLGIIATAGYKNNWRTRDTIQQTGSTLDLSQKELDFRRVITDDRIEVNGLLGFGLEFGENKIRWTNLYIRDTLKQARLGVGTRQTTSPTATLLQQDTAWFERQLIDTQLVGEFSLMPGLDLDVRGGFANSQREAPNEFSFEYFRSNNPNDPYGDYFVNRLNNGLNGSAEVKYSDLTEDLWSGGVDLSYELIPEVTATVGYAYSDTNRRTEVREFLFTAQSSFPTAVGLFRPDLLLQPTVLEYYGINLIDTNEANPVFRAKLRTHAGYLQFQAEISPAVSINAGVRYEDAKQTVQAVQVFDTPTASLASTNLARDYWLPAATITFQLADRMQLRINGSKTIARPQFRELVFQNYFDPDSNRQFRGNPLLVDSQLYNLEARYEWYFARDERVSLAGFYKRINNPIETFASFSDNAVLSSFANAPKADLYGAEFELQKYFDLYKLGDSAFWENRRLVVIANYTYTQSKLKVGPNDPVAVFASSSTNASDFFRNGVPLTGQSDHLVNLQLGLEDTESLSQQTILLSYASERVTNRGAGGQPDIVEKPGIQLDFVARQGIKILNDKQLELKFEVRNITGTKYQEFQESGANRIYYNLYDVGTVFKLGASVEF